MFLWSNNTPPKSKEEMEELVELFALFIDSKVNASETLPEQLSLALEDRIPSMPIKTYLRRYVEALALDEVALIAMMIYLDRYIKKMPNHRITYFCIHGLIASIIQVVHKVYFDEDEDDVCYPYAEIAEFSGKKMKELEVELLLALDYDVLIESKTYLKYKKNLVAYAREQMLIQYRAKPYPISITEDDLAMLRPVRHPSLDNLSIPLTQNYMAFAEQEPDRTLALATASVASPNELESKKSPGDGSSSSYSPRLWPPTINVAPPANATAKIKMCCQIL